MSPKGSDPAPLLRGVRLLVLHDLPQGLKGLGIVDAQLMGIGGVRGDRLILDALDRTRQRKELRLKDVLGEPTRTGEVRRFRLVFGLDRNHHIPLERIEHDRVYCSPRAKIKKHAPRRLRGSKKLEDRNLCVATGHGLDLKIKLRTELDRFRYYLRTPQKVQT